MTPGRGPTAAARRRKRSELFRGGTASLPVRENGQGASVRSLHVPSSVHTQTAAKVRGFSPTAQGFTAEIDSPLEGAGFEPSVPHQKGNAFRDSTVQLDPSQAGVPWDAI